MAPKFSISDFQKLLLVSRARKGSREDYFKFQQFQGELLIRYFNYHDINIAGKEILDLASGLGGYSSAFRKIGAKVVGLDINPNKNEVPFQFVVANALHAPFSTGSFDLVICASLIEHVMDPKILIKEILRLVPSNGYIYISFPPFYSLNGGHQFSPFHYFGEGIAINLSRKRELRTRQRWYKEIFPSSIKSYQTAFGNWGLYPLTIKKVSRIISEFPVRVIDRSTRWIPIDFSGLPLLGEFLTWHVQYLLQKI
jgi:SAM-dependent methyltransferase